MKTTPRIGKTVRSSFPNRIFGTLLKAVKGTGSRIVITRQGRTMAAIESIRLYDQWKRRRGAFFEKIQFTSEQANLSPDKAKMLVNGAIRAVRHQRKNKLREEQKRAFQELLDAPPCFEDIVSSVQYVRESRALDEKRQSKLDALAQTVDTFLVRVVRTFLQVGIKRTDQIDYSGKTAIRKLVQMQATGGPDNLSTNIDHYLYGAARKSG